MDVIIRHLELLKYEGLGIPQPETVKQICKKFGCTERTVYHDLETRTSWQPILQSVNKPEDMGLKTINRHEQIYRQASMLLHSAPNPFVQLGALNVMLKANSLMFDTAVLPSLMDRLRVLEQKASKGVFVP